MPLGVVAALGCVTALLGALAGAVVALEPSLGAAPATAWEPASRVALDISQAPPAVVARLPVLDMAPSAKSEEPALRMTAVSLTMPAIASRPSVMARSRHAPATGANEDVLAQIYEEPAESPIAPDNQANGALETSDTAAVRAALGKRPAPPVPGPAPRRPPWQRYAAATSATGALPMIAIVLDDLGLNRPAAWRAVRLPGPVTLSLMTYAHDLPRLADAARKQGHELLLHVPMEPRDPAFDAGPNVLRVDLDEKELRRRLEWGLGRFEGFVGINNHMGSKFTASAESIAPVMRELKSRGLLFLDSLTSSRSVGWVAADHAGVPFARRDVFLDHDWKNQRAIERQLTKLESIARRQGYAVGIGHPHRLTLEALERWLPEARRRGFALVPISAIVRHRIEVAHETARTTG